MKIYDVTFNDGGWHSGPRPSFRVVAENKENAIEKVLDANPFYRREGFDVWCNKLKIKGFVIKVYDKKTYKRDKCLDSLLEKNYGN